MKKIQQKEKQKPPERQFAERHEMNDKTSFAHLDDSIDITLNSTHNSFYKGLKTSNFTRKVFHPPA